MTMFLLESKGLPRLTHLFGKAPAQSCSRGQAAAAEAIGSYAPPDPGSVTSAVRKLKRGGDTP